MMEKLFESNNDIWQQYKVIIGRVSGIVVVPRLVLQNFCCYYWGIIFVVGFEYAEGKLTRNEETSSV